MQKVPIFFDVNAVADHSEFKKGEIVAQRVNGFHVLLASEAWVGCKLRSSCRAVAAVRERVEAREREAHLGYFDFTHAAHLKFYGLMDGVTVAGKYPAIRYKGDVLPPVMAAWAWGDISTAELLRLTNEYIKMLDCAQDIKKFFHELVYVAFDPEVMKTTCFVKPEARELLTRLRKDNFPAYLVLIGHCNPETFALMKEHEGAAEILPLFDKIIFSHQVRERVSCDTQFTDEKWRELAGIDKVVATSHTAIPHLFIDDDGQHIAGADGKPIVQPWHCTCASGKLETLLKSVKT